MFEDLSRKLDVVFRRLRGQGKLTEENVSESLREIRRILLNADVNYKVAKDFIAAVRDRAIGREVLQSITPGQLVVKIIHDELITLLGPPGEDVKPASSPPTVILVAGLQGSGKTTFCAKYASFLTRHGYHPLLIAADVHRPAAIDQLETLGRSIQIPVFADRAAGAVEVAKRGIEHARKNARDAAIVDTAGRLHVDEAMMAEVASIRDAVSPGEILFVVDAMTGQDAVNTAKAFHELLNFDGAVLTKMDGDARGGAAISLRATVGKPIRFIGVGEKLDALERFHPERMASRILGKGDVVTLVEKVQEQFDQEKAEKLEARLRTSKLTLDDFLEQLQQIRKMGPLNQVLGMLPGMHRLPDNVSVDENALVRIEAVIRSMTPEERSHPQIINGSRRKRIAAGSGTSIQEVNRLMKQFEQMQRMMKSLSKGGRRGRKFGGLNIPA